MTVQSCSPRPCVTFDDPRWGHHVLEDDDVVRVLCPDGISSLLSSATDPVAITAVDASVDTSVGADQQPSVGYIMSSTSGTGFLGVYKKPGDGALSYQAKHAGAHLGVYASVDEAASVVAETRQSMGDYVRMRRPADERSLGVMPASPLPKNQLFLSARSNAGFEGVHFNGRMYTAQIRTGGKICFLGSYETAEWAATAYAVSKRARKESSEVLCSTESKVTHYRGYKLFLSASTSGYIGVRALTVPRKGLKRIRKPRYVATFGSGSGGTYCYLGTFDGKLEAALAYARHVNSLRRPPR
jgi:hypothetical protein